MQDGRGHGRGAKGLFRGPRDHTGGCQFRAPKHPVAQCRCVLALPSFTCFRSGTFRPCHLKPHFPLLRDVGQWANLVDEHSKVFLLEEVAEKGRLEHDPLWREMQAEASVSEEGRTALLEHEPEQNRVREEL